MLTKVAERLYLDFDKVLVMTIDDEDKLIIMFDDAQSISITNPSSIAAVIQFYENLIRSKDEANKHMSTLWARLNNKEST